MVLPEQEADAHRSVAVPWRPLRVAHVSVAYPPCANGTATVVAYNARELARLGHQVEVFTAAVAEPPVANDLAVRVHRLRTPLRFRNTCFLEAFGYQVWDFDLMHLHFPFYFGAEQVWWHCRRRCIPFVVTYHQDVLYPWPGSLAVRAHHRLLGARILRAAAAVVTPSLDYAHSSRLADLGLRHVVEIPNGVDTDLFRPAHDTADPLRARLGLGSRDVVLFVGMLDGPHYFKGIPQLITAMAQLPDAALVVVGDGERQAAYAAIARRAGLGARAVFVGQVPHEALTDYYALARIVVLPSTTRSESFGLVLLEAMASGRPVVASRLPGVRTVVDDGETGLLVRPGDSGDLAAKIATVLRDTTLQERLAAAGRRKAEHYGWQRIAVRLQELYFQVVQRNGDQR